MTGGKLVGRVVAEDAKGYTLQYPASLTFPIEALDAGQRFAIKASLMGIVAVDEVYYLSRAAVRGHVTCGDAWLMDVYSRFRGRAEAGEFRLNPYAKAETELLMQGTGEAEAEDEHINVIHADPVPAENEAPSA